MNLIQISGLNKKYLTLDGEITALDSVSFGVKEGEFVAIVGSSGSGKSTLLNMLAGLDRPDSGSIVFDEMDIVKLSNAQTAELRRKKIGVIYQFYNLIPELNVSENITLPTELGRIKADQARLIEILSAVGMESRAQAYPNTLSGGQQQRVAVARALFNEPSLILADEPTGNLDPQNSAEVLNLLKNANKQFGVTILVVTHSDSVAAEADRVIKMENGRIISDRKIKNEADN